MLDLPTGTVRPAGDSRARPLDESPDQGEPKRASSGRKQSHSKHTRTESFPQVREDVRRRSKAELAAEIDALRQELDAYETRRQEVIDRYERLLTEYRRQCGSDSSRDPSPGRLERVRLQVLRALGLR